MIVMVVVNRDSYMKKMKMDAVLSFSTLKVTWGWQSWKQGSKNEIMIMTKRVIYMTINMTSTRETRITLKILTIMDILSKKVKINSARSRPDLFLSLALSLLLCSLRHLPHLPRSWTSSTREQFVFLVNRRGGGNKKRRGNRMGSGRGGVAIKKLPRRSNSHNFWHQFLKSISQIKTLNLTKVRLPNYCEAQLAKFDLCFLTIAHGLGNGWGRWGIDSQFKYL